MDVEQVGDRLDPVRLVHGGLAFSPLTWANVKDGWVWVLDALKTVLEPAGPCPGSPPTRRSPAPAEGDWHRRQGVEANNAVFPLLEPSATRRRRAAAPARLRSGVPLGAGRRRGPGERRPRRLPGLPGAHRDRAAGAGAAGRPTGCSRRREHGIADFDLAYAHEARARALHALGRADEAAAAWLSARAVEVSDPEDRAIVAADFAALAPVLG